MREVASPQCPREPSAAVRCSPRLKEFHRVIESVDRNFGVRGILLGLWLRWLPVHSRLVAHERALARVHSGRAAGSRPCGAHVATRARGPPEGPASVLAAVTGWDAAPIGAVALVEAPVTRNLAAVGATAGGLAAAAGVAAAFAGLCWRLLRSGLDDRGRRLVRCGGRVPREPEEKERHEEWRSWRALRMEATLSRERVRNELSSQALARTAARGTDPGRLPQGLWARDVPRGHHRSN